MTDRAPGGEKKPKARPELEAEEVASYLRRNPGFLAERADLAALLTPPPRNLGEGVVDLQQFVLERLRTDMARLKLTQRKLIATSRNNLASQGKVHAAVLALLGAQSFEQFIGVITDEMAMMLDIDAVGLCVEASSAQFPVGQYNVQVMPTGTSDDLFDGVSGDVLLRADVTGDTRLFGGAAAGLVRSDAIIRLRISAKAPTALLALGARRPGIFHPGQGTELVGFLAQVIEHLFRAWLDLPG